MSIVTILTWHGGQGGSEMSLRESKVTYLAPRGGFPMVLQDCVVLVMNLCGEIHYCMSVLSLNTHNTGGKTLYLYDNDNDESLPLSYNICQGGNT